MNFKSPDVVIVPVGNARNIIAICKGFDELPRIGVIDETLRVVGIKAQRAAPIAPAYKLKSTEIQRVEKPETIVTAIRIGAPAGWKEVL